MVLVALQAFGTGRFELYMVKHRQMLAAKAAQSKGEPVREPLVIKPSKSAPMNAEDVLDLVRQFDSRPPLLQYTAMMYELDVPQLQRLLAWAVQQLQSEVQHAAAVPLNPAQASGSGTPSCSSSAPPASWSQALQALFPTPIMDMEVKIILNKAIGAYKAVYGGPPPPADPQNPTLRPDVLPPEVNGDGTPRLTLRESLLPDLVRLQKKALAEFQAENGELSTPTALSTPPSAEASAAPLAEASAVGGEAASATGGKPETVASASKSASAQPVKGMKFHDVILK